jgi:ArsR family transcriptional regulator
LTDVDAWATLASNLVDVRRGSLVTDAATAAAAGAGACCVPLDAPTLSPEEARATAALFRALADRHRVRIVNLLATSPDPVCVCELTEVLGISQPTTSHHLKTLFAAGLLDREQRGTWAYYSLNRDTLGRLAAVVDLQGATP